MSIRNTIRFWQTKIHEGDRRGTKSQIEIGSDGDSVKDHADVTKESSEDSASKVTKRMVMVMVMVMVKPWIVGVATDCQQVRQCFRGATPLC